MKNKNGQEIKIGDTVTGDNGAGVNFTGEVVKLGAGYIAVKTEKGTLPYIAPESVETVKAVA